MCQKMEEASRALSSALAGGDLRDIATLPAGPNAHRPHPAVYLPGGKEAVVITRFGGLGEL
jgi:hypothetical protein